MKEVFLQIKCPADESKPDPAAPEATSSKKEWSYSEAVDEPIEKAIVSPEFIART